MLLVASVIKMAGFHSEAVDIEKSILLSSLLVSPEFVASLC